jgi:hypothetical protein
LHYLSVLTENGHPAAQALLADLLWRGRYVKKNEQLALALITVSVKNAPTRERLWSRLPSDGNPQRKHGAAHKSPQPAALVKLDVGTWGRNIIRPSARREDGAVLGSI